MCQFSPRSVYIRDPDVNLIELSVYERLVGDQAVVAKKK